MLRLSTGRRALFLLFVVAIVGGAAQTPSSIPSPAGQTPSPLPSTLANGGFTQFFLNRLPVIVQGYRVWLAQDYQKHFGSLNTTELNAMRAEFQEDARWMLSTWLGCNISHVRFADANSPRSSPMVKDPRSFFELWIDEPVGMQVGPDFKAESPAWLIGSGAKPQQWFIKKWELGVVPCNASEDTTASNLPGQAQQLCNWVDKELQTPAPPPMPPSLNASPPSVYPSPVPAPSVSLPQPSPPVPAPVDTLVPSPSPVPNVNITQDMPPSAKVTFPPGFLPVKNSSPAAKKSRKLMLGGRRG